MNQTMRRWALRMPGGSSATDATPAPSSRLSARGAWLAVVAALAFAACGDAGQSDAADGAAADAAAEAETAMITAMNPWVRMAIVPEGSDAPDAPPVNSAAYLVLTNPTDRADALLAVETEVSDTVEVHTVTMDEGVMRMRAVDSVPVPAGGQAVLEPGGYHIMLIGLRGPLAEGDSVELRLRLRSGRVIDVTAPVRKGPDGV